MGGGRGAIRGDLLGQTQSLHHGALGERERGHHMFPKRIRFLMALARLLPEPIRRRILAGAAA